VLSHSTPHPGSFEPEQKLPASRNTAKKRLYIEFAQVIREASMAARERWQTVEGMKWMDKPCL
jgi:hypothetical protein